jgi:hypothetical protein
MERSTYIWISVITFLIAMSASLVYFSFSYSGSGPIASPSNIKNLEECKVASYSGENSINFVFFSTKQKSLDYFNFLVNAEPFTEHKDKFNIFYIDDYDVDQDCEIYKGIALLCDSRNLVKKAASCPHDYIVILKDKQSSIRSSAYQNILSINSVHPKTVFLHEFGHAFANFAEEYVAGTAKIPRGSQNCQESCEGFGDEKDGCFRGCSDAEHYRSIDNGVMRTLSSDEYGIFNEGLINSRIDESLASLFSKVTGSISRITGSAIAGDIDNTCSNREFYLGVFKYTEENGLELIDEEAVVGCAGGSGYGEIDYRLLDSDGNTILQRNIDPFTLFIEGPGDTDENGLIQIEGDITERLSSVIIQAPIIFGIDELKLIDTQGRTTSVNLIGVGGRACLV